ncbi:MAG TPA: bifunctional (p)ppGpp synthetase/guanosine-3',5'-bis(diphosphate) 3'-pyrophosphohydrolase [Actinomycetota bacterium]|nr:bifunctional (p)ppGpp synthetase/guanosine-3',5'-bis(diphosphate) 3'-pyrophosphohydrolase [Actinomycetota bacterium]
MLSRLRPGEHEPAKGGIDALLRTVKSYNAKADLREIERAYRFAELHHEGQTRLSGEDFIQHPLAVAQVMADLGLDTTTLQAALLHDTVEDTDVTLEQLEEGFGTEVARIVDGLTKLDSITPRSREHAQAENVRKMIVAMAGDIRVLLIKLADRLHNMRTLAPLPPEKQRRIATETLDIYAPLAHRLGVQQVKWELEDLAFKTLHPGPYREIANLVEKRRGERQEYVDAVLDAARTRLREAGVKAEVIGRPKHLYSIYEKMVVVGKEFNEIYDLAGVRILVDSVRDCYAALGAVHSLWKPVPGRFKDYVAMPKSNMYQSLHTTVVGPQGRSIEVQLRTRDMHRTAEYGIAAHWRYKEGRDGKKAKEAADLAWLGQMLEWLKDMADPREFMEGLKIDLYGGQVFVFTPKGDVMNLPSGATPVDFAYAIHTEVGHRTIGAKVNGKLVPLDYELRTGDTVEILASKAESEGPSQDWLRFVKTPRARNKIRQWFSRERREDALEEGKDALQRLMRRQNVPFKRLATEEALRQLAEEMKFPGLDSLFVAIGEGHVSPQSVVARLTRSVSGTPEEDVTEVPLARPVRIERPDLTAGVVVPGSVDVWVRLARCCTPVPGDEIMGFVTRGQGVSVHRTDCPNARALSAQQERLIDVSWRSGKPTSFVVAIQVEALDRTRLLSDVATVLSDHHVNILSATSSVGRDRTTTLRFTFELADIAHLTQILAAVRKVENVYEAFRVVPR